jgi:hypothetical protein
MMPGVCSDAPCPRHPDGRLLPAGSLQKGEKSIRFPAVTISWLEWLLEKGEPDSNWYDFAEERPFWTMWWFRTCATALCICLVWILWLVA